MRKAHILVFLNLSSLFLKALRLVAPTLCWSSMFHLLTTLLEKNTSNSPECTSFYLILSYDLVFPCYSYPVETSLEALLLTFTEISRKPLSSPVCPFFPPMSIILDTLVYLFINLALPCWQWFLWTYVEPFSGAPCLSYNTDSTHWLTQYSTCGLTIPNYEHYPCLLILNCPLYHPHYFTIFIQCI